MIIVLYVGAAFLTLEEVNNFEKQRRAKVGINVLNSFVTSEKISNSNECCQSTEILKLML